MMRGEMPEPERLCDLPVAEGSPPTAEERAAEVLRTVGEPLLLTRQQLAEAKPRFGGPERAASWRRAFQGATVAAVIAGTAGFVAARSGFLQGHRPIVVEVPPGSTSHITAPGGSKVHVVGPSSVEAAAPSFVLRQGTMVVEAGQEPLALAVGDMAVTVSAGSSARMTTESGNTRVENLAGEVVLRQGTRKESVPVGESWYKGLITAAAGSAGSSSGNVIGRDVAVPSAPASPPPDAVFGADPWGAAKDPEPIPLDTGKLAAPDRSGDHAESHLLGMALRKLRKEGDARGALDLFDQYEKRFPDGRLAPEARLGRVESLMALGRRSDALVILDGSASSDLRRPIRVLRGELRAGAGRCSEALSDFAAALSAEPHDTLDDRALFGRAFCRSETGDKAGAKGDLALYEARFPSGQFIAQVRRSLSNR